MTSLETSLHEFDYVDQEFWNGKQELNAKFFKLLSWNTYIHKLFLLELQIWKTKVRYFSRKQWEFELGIQMWNPFNCWQLQDLLLLLLPSLSGRYILKIHMEPSRYPFQDFHLRMVVLVLSLILSQR